MPAAAVAEKPLPHVAPEPTVRRFEVPDLERHGGWLMQRFLTAFPHLNERQAVGFLRGMAYSNEHIFLFSEHGCALFQMMNEHALDPHPVIWERFVWAQDPGDPKHVLACADFYDSVKRWAQTKGVSILHVEEKTDVGEDEIKKRLGRVLEIKQKVARL